MYTREITNPPENIIVDGKPIFGTFNKPFEKMEIRGIKRPFGDLPFPPFITNLRIRAALVYSFSTQDYIGTVDIFDAKIFGYTEIILWDKNSGKKYAFRTVRGPHRKFIPKTTGSGVCVSFGSKRYVRISWSEKDKRLSVLLNIKGDDIRPNVSASLTMPFDDAIFAQQASVLPAQIMRRCVACVQKTGSLKGTLTIADSVPQKMEGLSFFETKKAYYSLRTRQDYLTGMGVIDGKSVCFHLSYSSMAASDEYKYNSNVLFVDGKAYPLPPVKITRPKGIMGTWIIQDTESMVDLAFDPISDTERTLSVLIVRTGYHTIYGTFSGALLTGEGETLTLKDVSGIGKKLRIRF